MHDGQNLFDAAASFAGEWRVDETLEVLSAEGIEMIVVGVCNTPDRTPEYNPFDHPYFGKGKGRHYLAFVFDTVKPLIDLRFRTLPDAAHTGMAGSSLGGLITLAAYFMQPARLGFAAALSPSLWIARSTLYDFIENAPAPPGRLYMDIGLKEFSAYVRRRFPNPTADHQALTALLERKGYARGERLVYVEDKDGQHNESDWARRFPDVLRFLAPRLETA
jgi:predicted alpha/beta superfamily hydrolase